MLAVDVLPLLPLHRVRARVEVEGPWTLTGHAEGRSWKVADGAGPAWLSDPWAPVGLAVGYTLTTDGGTFEAGPVVRTYHGYDAFTDLQGQGVVDFIRESSRRSQQPRHTTMDVPGERLSPFMSAPVAGAGGGSLVARTLGPASDAMDALIGRNVPVVMLHNQVLCEIPGCRFEPVMTLLLRDVDEERTRRTDAAEHAWSLTYTPAPVPWGYVPPVATLGEMTERWPTVGDLAASGLTVGELAAGDWLVA